MTSRSFAPLALLALVGCGGDGTGPAERGPVQLSLVHASAPLVGTVGTMLPVALEVQATFVETDAPAPGQIVNFVVVEPGCGRAFAGTATTNEAGTAREQWELGTKAGPCTMEVRYVDQTSGEPRVLGAFAADVLPGAADTVWLQYNSIEPAQRSDRVFVPSGDSLPLRALVRRAADRFGNVVTDPAITATVASGTAIVQDGYLVGGSGETAGELALQVGNLQLTVPFAVGVDLRARRWSAKSSCPFRGNVYPPTGNVPVDSLQLDLVVDSVRYYMPGEISPKREIGTLGTVWASGTTTYYLRDGTTESAAVREYDVGLHSQGPEGIDWWSWFSSAGVVGAALSVQTSADPLRYEGGTWCKNADFAMTPALELEEIP